MYQNSVLKHILNKASEILPKETLANSEFLARFLANSTDIFELYEQLYGNHPNKVAEFQNLISTVFKAHKERRPALKKRDEEKESQGSWFLSNDLVGMSLYVDRFAGTLAQMKDKLPYLKDLGVNFLHFLPLFESPNEESDGGYAVSNYRKINPKLGSIDDFATLQNVLHEQGFYIMVDIVINHTSHHHEWAQKAKQGDPIYKDYYYFYPNRTVPDLMEPYMSEIFPESSPGNFTFVPELNQWVMSVFNSYQWDLNFKNPTVFVAMLDTIFFYANLGVDVLRIDAPAFIWKQIGTSCQNLPEAHTLLQLIKLCVKVAAPGMALLGEAIVAPVQIIQYFGTGRFTAHECDFAYNATQMALQWDALATTDTRIMLSAQYVLQKKPLGTSWLNYTRCHDDIGLGFDDYMIRQEGFDPYLHREYLKNYYSGILPDSPSSGALFGVNPKTNDARISGTLASLCGLEKARKAEDKNAVETALNKIILMQAQSMLIGGIPVLFYGDEVGYENDYSYQKDPGKSYDNRWMHRPIIDWNKNAR
ncbi:MAG TPA: alpha-amylase family glycosyl hydrolase, partial [Flavobacteriaceae bacterium]|nr:alpha-amylase family glycosyl hydrolase [Flavobacteriaceae bacterium]